MHCRAILSIRKIKKDEVENYLNPSIKNILPNPLVLKDMDLAVKRSVKAIQKKESITFCIGKRSDSTGKSSQDFWGLQAT